MIIKGNKIYVYGKGFEKTSIKIGNGKILEINEDLQDNEVINADEMYVLPGFIDIHTHGAVSVDTMDADYEGLLNIKKYMAENGVTAFMPTTMSMALDDIEKAIINVKECSKASDGAEIIGIHMEGPSFCEKYKGAQNSKYLRNPKLEEIEGLIKAGEGLVKIISIAPELEGSKEFIEEVTKKYRITISVAHTNADYETVMGSFKWGISHATHLFNAMSAFTHRTPGTVGAILDSGICSEIICDGVHLHPATARIAIKTLGTYNVVLISDSMRATGMPDGVYDLGGQNITVKDNSARTENGNLAGSTTNVLSCFKNVIKWGIKIEDAVKMASQNPARQVKAENKGKISKGADADFTILDKDFNLVYTIVGGEIKHSRG